MKKRFSLEVGMLIFISTLVLIVSISGIITYQNITSLTFDLKKGTTPDNKVILLKQITADLYETESSVRTFYFTRDSAYLTNYTPSKNLVENRMTVLESYLQNDPLNRSRLDSIRYFVQEKYLVMDEWLVLEKNEKVTKELSKLPEKIDSEAKKTINDDTSEKIRKKDKKNYLDVQLLENEVKKIQQQQTSQLRALNQQELMLNIKNKAINDALRNIVARMEKEEKSSLAELNENAIQKANITNFIIAAFCTSAVFLLVIFGTTLFRYIVKTREYNRALKNAHLEAENLAEAKQNFLANMTHEIRTPINSILGFTEQLDKSSLSNQQREYLQIVKKSSIHLLKIVNDVLDYSKLQAGKFSFEKIIFNPAETIQEVIDILLPEAEAKSIKVHFQKNEGIPDFLRGDPFRLQQILLNLMGNAIKFTGSGSIFVVVNTEKMEGNELLLKVEVRDTGIGIPAHKVDKVFGDFEQADSNISRKFRGTGLGLSITKKLVENQQGSIHIISKEGAGTVVNFVIPYEVVNNHQETVVSDKRIDSTFLAGKKILIVDDEPFNRKLLRTILLQWGATVEEAHDGENALFLVNNKQYDLVLMDVRMPGMTGIEITRRIRSHEKPEIRNLIIIALTASNDKEKEMKCLEAGMNAFLPKPFTEQQFFEVVNKTFSGLPSPQQNDISISMNELSKLANGDKNFVKEMARLFIKGAEESVETIKKAYEVDDWGTIRSVTHKVAPSCRHLGATKMLELVKLIEKQAENDVSKADLNVLIHELEVESSAAIDEVKKYLV